MMIKFLLVILAHVAIASALPHLRAGMPAHGIRHVEAPKAAAAKKLVCYLGSWSVYHPGDGKFDIEDIDPHACSHLIYGFAALDPISHEITAFDPWNDLEEDGGKGAYRRFTNLRNQNPQLTTILAIGGWNAGSQNYSEMASDPARRQIFIQSCLEFIPKYGFQGLDLDWEYPTFRGGDDNDKANFAALIRELKAAFKPAGLLLTAAVSAGKFTMEGAYDMQALIDSLDMISVMSYDFHGAWDPFVHHNAPIHGHALDSLYGEYEFFNIDYAIRYWIDLMGVHSDRLVMGLPLYSRGFTLEDPKNSTIYAKASAGIAGPYTQQAGVLGFHELCEIKRDQPSTFKTYWHDDLVAKHVIFENQSVADQWFSFDDLEAMSYKVKLIQDLPIGGGMVWSIDSEDFHGVCGEGRNPLLNYISKELLGGVGPTNPPPRTTVQPGDGECHQPGPNPIGPCSDSFLQCVQEGDHWIGTTDHCAPGLIFNPEFLICDYPEHVTGCLREKH